MANNQMTFETAKNKINRARLLDKKVDNNSNYFVDVAFKQCEKNLSASDCLKLKQHIKKLQPKKQTISKVWCGHIPEIYGYGIMVIECTEDECRKSLKRMFQAWRKTMKGAYNYPEAMDYFGGRIFEVVIGKQYYDGLGS